ncbi:hypothetical protein HAX54_026653 [Datura stramonium]|uniref:GDSL esterase/lipase n=1 Tax=Datura stramonium TaxID=4076 RepID=A0ABS8V3J2_DATST|nr:hypothetical protein [Datura stramonium]
MATLSLTQCSLFLLLITLAASFFSPSSAQTKCNIKSVYQLGDSLADAGNVIRTPGATIIFHADRSPYGETFFRRPTGRFSNGRVITDFISQSFKLSFLNAYLDRGASFTQGVNFSVAGATALNTSFWTARNIRLPTWNTPLSNQLGIYPLGCLPLYLTTFPDNNTSVYDQLGCLRNFNDFASYHNRYVNRAMANLQREFPNVSIVYGDFYGAILTLIHRASFFGFNQNTLLSACCGTGG